MRPQRAPAAPLKGGEVIGKPGDIGAICRNVEFLQRGDRCGLLRLQPLADAGLELRLERLVQIVKIIAKSLEGVGPLLRQRLAIEELAVAEDALERGPAFLRGPADDLAQWDRCRTERAANYRSRCSVLCAVVKIALAFHEAGDAAHAAADRHSARDGLRVLGDERGQDSPGNLCHRGRDGHVVLGDGLLIALEIAPTGVGIAIAFAAGNQRRKGRDSRRGFIADQPHRHGLARHVQQRPDSLARVLGGRVVVPDKVLPDARADALQRSGIASDKRLLQRGNGPGLVFARHAVTLAVGAGDEEVGHYWIASMV